ncbi:Xaa-Pro peptidase family protein [Rhodanobacter sp. T12-5]|uniref:M24 family metallopeptidase n=1 Tax=Rhodanobacter sp. T12-5 TaxID=2024611 RepID=UPI0018DA0A9F|nr:Xaa-Pro peptidase family protein [Rhodanobacter sp. T12-5]
MNHREDAMHPGRRRFLQTTALGAAALPVAMLGRTATATEAGTHAIKLPASILALQPVASQEVPIADDERRARLAKAQELMGRFGMDAIYLDGGTTLDYYTGMHWWTSERLMGMLLPKSGEPVYITPAFERSRALEQIRFGHDVRTWQENESPYALIAQVMRQWHAGTGVLGIEEKVPFFRSTGIAAAMPQAKLVPATPVTAGCRAIKSPAELALMQLACDATLALYKAIWQGLEPGMTQQHIATWVDAGYTRMGLRGDASINVGAYTALPHGSREPQVIREGTPVMLDDGCYVDGYMSDLTRTFTLGKASDKMKRVFDIVRKAQQAALAAAHPGATMESVDAAARKVIADAGYGPGYTYFSHRLGHGIGMDMHEWYYLVQGNTRRIETGMTFSDEPGIYIPGEFGVRLEDDMHVGVDGARLFTPQSPSIERPFG